MNKLFAATLVSIGVAAAVPAFAQTTGTAPEASRGQQSAQRQFERRPAMKPSERVEAQLAYIRTALKITPAQQSAFDAYASVKRKHAADMDKRFEARRASMAQRGADAKRPTFIERRERQRERLVTATQRFDELLAVEKPLFAALSPEQQRVAGEVLSGGGHRHGGGHHHRGGGRFGRA